MAEDILISIINEPIYTKKYKLHGPLLSGHEAVIYAECTENPACSSEDKHYLLSFFLSVDGYGMRDFLVGVPFGHAGMSQKEIDQEVVYWIQDYVIDKLMENIHMYLKKEELYEDWLNEDHRD